MSVPEGKRTKSKLEVQTKAIELARYTIKICSNEKRFPKRYRWCLTSKIVDTAIEIMSEANTANSIYVTMKCDYELRRNHQASALAYTAKMLGLVELAYVQFNIDDNRIKYWTKIIIDVRELLKKWKKADRQRYKNVL